MAVNIKKEQGSTRNRKPDLTTLVFGKVPPQAPDMEEAVLAACMIERDTFLQVTEIIPSESCFYVDAHQKIYAALGRLSTKGMPIDLLTLTEELRKSNELELIGGAHYLTNLSSAVLTGAHVEAHARIIMEKFIQRELIRVSGQVIGDAYEDTTDVFELLDKAESELYQVSLRNVKKDFSPINKVVHKVMEQDQEMLLMPEGLVGIPTGNGDLDSLTGGFKPGKLIIIAARPSVGKTAHALNIAYNAALNNKKPVGFFSLEMENDELLRRLISIDTKLDTYLVDYPKTRTGEEQIMIDKSYQRLAPIPLFFDDTPALTTGELRAKARRMKSKHNIGMIIVDYLQLMQGDSGDSRNREAEIAKISRELKALAKSLKIAVIALCQLNRDIEKRTNNEFRLSDLRESGAIEQDADIVGFLWRPTEDEIKKQPDLKGIGKLDIVKHRGGKKGKIIYSIDMSTQTWANYDPFPNQKPKKPVQNYQAPTISFNVNVPSDSKDDLPF
jgi:replicative DNA helicase